MKELYHIGFTGAMFHKLLIWKFISDVSEPRYETKDLLPDLLILCPLYFYYNEQNILPSFDSFSYFSMFGCQKGIR